MNKNELVAEMARRGKYTRDDINNMLEIFIDVVSDTLQSGESIRMHNFGSFNVVDVKERVNKNPGDGKEVLIPAHKTVRFKVSPTLKSLDIK